MVDNGTLRWPTKRSVRSKNPMPPSKPQSNASIRKDITTRGTINESLLSKAS